MMLFSMRSAIVAVTLTAAASLGQSNEGLLNSPDGGVSMRFRTVVKNAPASPGQIVYSVKFLGKPLLDDSALRLDLQGMRPLGPEVRTVALSGIPGEWIAIARRHGDDWCLGTMTNWTPRLLDIPLTFLGKGRYTAEIYADAEDADRLPKNVSIRKTEVDANTRLKARLAPGGGYAVRFVPINR
jgi:hypothetical protein